MQKLSGVHLAISSTYERPILPKFWKEAQKYIRAAESASYSKGYKKQFASRETNQRPEETLHHDAPNLQDWLKANPDKGINDYYGIFRK